LLGAIGQRPGPKSGYINMDLSWDSKVDIKPNFIRFHQFDPSRYKKYRIKKIKLTVEMVIGFASTKK